MLFVHGHKGSQSCLNSLLMNCHGSPYYRLANNSSLNAMKLATFTMQDTPFQPLNVDTAMNSTVYWITSKWSWYADSWHTCIYSFLNSFNALTFTVCSTEATCTVTHAGSVIQGSAILTHSTTGYNAIKEKGKFWVLFSITYRCNAFAKGIIIDIKFANFAVDKVRL